MHLTAEDVNIRYNSCEKIVPTYDLLLLGFYKLSALNMLESLIETRLQLSNCDAMF